MVAVSGKKPKNPKPTVGKRSKYSAAAPAACPTAIEVPLCVEYASSGA